MRNSSILGQLLLLAATASPALLITQPATAQVQAIPSLIPGLPYSGAVKAGNTIYVGGVLGLAPDGKTLASGGIESETSAAFNHIESMLEKAGGSKKDIAKCTVLLSDINHFSGLNKVFRERFPVDPPTRSTIVVPAIPMNAAIEVDCTAYLDPSQGQD